MWTVAAAFGNRLARLDWVWRIYASRSCGKTRITLRIAATIDALQFSAWPKLALKWWIRRSSRPSTAPQLTSPSQMLSSCEPFFFLNSFIIIIFLPIITSFLFACSRNWFDFSMLLFQTARLPSQTSKWSWKCIRACCRMICRLRQHPASCKSHYTRPFPGRSAANYLPRWKILTVSKTTPCKYLDINQCSLPLTSWFCFAVGLTLMESSVIFFSFSFWWLLFVFSL